MITWATLITLLRIILIIPLVVLLLDNNIVGAAVILAVACFTDLIDGYVARTYNQRSKMGEVLDPLADKLLMLTTFTTVWFTMEDLVPTWLLIFLWCKEGILAIGALIFFVTSHRLQPARRSGKMAMLFQVMYGLLLFFTRYTELQPVWVKGMQVGVFLTALYALYDYAKHGFSLIKKSI